MSAVDRPGIFRPFAAGLGAGIAAASSLLTAPAGPVFLIWMLIVNRAGSRVSKALALCCGFVIPSIPFLRLLIKSPHNVIFGVLQYWLPSIARWSGTALPRITLAKS